MDTMDTSAAINLASAVQSASIQHNPDPAHDLNPSTSASEKAPVRLTQPLTQSSYEEIDVSSSELEDGIDVEEEDIPYSVLSPVERRKNLPPLPDMRFEQSYLKSIEAADTNWRVAYITLRDQVLLPLFQGTLYSLALLGWRHWNRAASVSGTTVGARVRRWWWGVNNWPLEDERARLARRVRLARDAGDYYQIQQGAGGD